MTGNTLPIWFTTLWIIMSIVTICGGIFFVVNETLNGKSGRNFFNIYNNMILSTFIVILPYNVVMYLITWQGLFLWYEIVKYILWSYLEIMYITFIYLRSSAVLGAGSSRNKLRFAIYSTYVSVLVGAAFAAYGESNSSRPPYLIGLLLSGGPILALDIFYIVMFVRYVRQATAGIDEEERTTEPYVIAKFGLISTFFVLAAFILFIVASMFPIGSTEFLISLFLRMCATQGILMGMVVMKFALYRYVRKQKTRNSEISSQIVKASHQSANVSRHGKESQLDAQNFDELGIKVW